MLKWLQTPSLRPWRAAARSAVVRSRRAWVTGSLTNILYAPLLKAAGGDDAVCGGGLSMNVLFQSPLGALLAKPWVDQAGLFGLRRWYMPLSRLWAAANQAGDDAALFREQVGACRLSGPDFRLRGLLGRHDRLRQAADEARAGWEAAIFDPGGDADPGALDAAGVRPRRATS